MKSIILKSITLENFQGVKKSTINFNSEITNILGANESGKSTHQDAFLWLMFGKNSEDKKDFNIKNTKETDLNRQDHEVKADLEIDGTPLNIRRIYKEKWQKKKGAEFAEFTGHETEFYWNDVPVSLSEYQNKISAILPELIFKMLTNPLAFNSLKWNEQRSILLEIGETLSDVEVLDKIATIENKQVIMNITNALNSDKSIQEYEKQVKASITKSKQDLKEIQPRIDEVLKTKAESHDFDSLRIEQSKQEKTLAEVEKSISDKASAFDVVLETENKKKLEANTIKSKIQVIEQTAKTNFDNLNKKDNTKLLSEQSILSSKELELKSYENTAASLESKKTDLQNQVTKKDESKKALLTKWHENEAKVFSFDEEECVCPSCKRKVDESELKKTIEKAKTDFANEKVKVSDEINASGIQLKKDIELLNEEIKTINSRLELGKGLIEKLKPEIETLKESVKTETDKFESEEVKVFDLDSELKNNKEYHDLVNQLKTIESTIIDNPKIDNDALIEQKSELVKSIDEIKNKLRNELQNDSVDKRVTELKNQEQELAQFIANVEKEIFVIEKFNKAKINSLEQSINSKFELVKFKMFETQINGSDVECCEAWLNGKPFSSLNTAAKIVAGIDVINCLSNHYGFNAPIWIDNRESITEIIPSQSQIINLIVSPEHKELAIN